MDWQPIETAPKDWRPYRVKFRHGTSICRPVPNGFIYEAEQDQKIEDLGGPTHWMPLPEPPSARTTG